MSPVRVVTSARDMSIVLVRFLVSVGADRNTQQVRCSVSQRSGGGRGWGGSDCGSFLLINWKLCFILI